MGRNRRKNKSPANVPESELAVTSNNIHVSAEDLRNQHRSNVLSLILKSQSFFPDIKHETTVQDSIPTAPLFTSDILTIDSPVRVPPQCSVLGRLFTVSQRTTAETGWGRTNDYGKGKAWDIPEASSHEPGWDISQDLKTETNWADQWWNDTSQGKGSSKVGNTGHWGDAAGTSVDVKNSWIDNESNRGQANWNGEKENSKEEEKGGESSVLLLNTNTPWTVFICGLQGSGKSHSLTVLLESCLISNQSIGILKAPLAAIVFHYSPYNPIFAGKPCEAAYLASSRLDGDTATENSTVQSITVLVSRSNMPNMQKVYSDVPNVTLKQFVLKPSQLTITTMLHLMSVQQDTKTPLYMQIVNRVLREIATDTPDGGFNYDVFKTKMKKEQLHPDQKGPLNQRLSLLESFIGPEDGPDNFGATPGTLTIIDLTCPFVDSETACVLFTIANELFCSAPCETGKIVALDEAHRFMTVNPAATRFAAALISNIRLQRHIGVRTIVSTQDPQIHPEILELASVIMLHRFNSPRWFKTLSKHIGFDSTGDAEDSGNTATGKTEYDRRNNNSRREGGGIFRNITHLNTGEAYIYCPQLVMRDDNEEGGKLRKFGNGVLKVRVRQKLTWDGGVSKNVLEDL